MAAKNNRNQKERNVRDRLLKEATALFAHNGYTATPIREIVAQAGVTKPVLYYYFGSKEGLFQAILEEAAIKQKFLLEKAVSGEGTARERIHYLCNLIYDHIRENRDLTMMIHGSIFGPDKLSPAYNFLEFRERTLETIQQMCSEGIASGELTGGEPVLMAQLLLAIIDSVVFVDLTLSGEDHPERITELLALTFKGLNKKDSQHV